MAFLSDPITFIGHWLETLLLGWNLAPGLVNVIMKLIGAATAGLVSLGLVIFTIWMGTQAVCTHPGSPGSQPGRTLGYPADLSRYDQDFHQGIHHPGRGR